MIALVYVPFGSREEAERVARAMIDKGLAACANILPAGLSIYKWHTEVQTAEETVVLFKSSMQHVDILKQSIADTHSYTLPAILSWNADVSPEFARWVEGELGGSAG